MSIANTVIDGSNGSWSSEQNSIRNNALAELQKFENHCAALEGRDPRQVKPMSEYMGTAEHEGAGGFYSPEYPNDLYVNDQYLNDFDTNESDRAAAFNPPVACPIDYRTYRGLRLFRLNKLVYDSSTNQVEDRINDLMVSVYGALHSLSASALIIIDAYPGHVDFYIGTNSDVNASTAGLVLEKGLKGNFPGSKFSFLDHGQTVQLASRFENTNGADKSISSVVMVPSLRGESQHTYLQGIEKMIDALQGERYTALLVSEPLGQDAVEERKRGFEQLYSTLSPFAQTSLAYGDNISSAVSDGTFTSFSDSINTAVSNTNSEGTSTSSGTTDGTSSGWSGGYSSSSGGGGSSEGYNYGFNSSTSHSTSRSTGTSASWSRSVTRGKTKTSSVGDNHTETQTTGESRTLTITYEDKTVSGLMEQISEQLTRIKNNEIYGWWMTGAYFLADDVQTSVVAANTFRALIAGDESYVDNAFILMFYAFSRIELSPDNMILHIKLHLLLSIINAIRLFLLFIFYKEAYEINRIMCYSVLQSQYILQ